MIEIEINYIKENLPGRITKIIEKIEQFDKKVSQTYIKELLSKKLASGNTYQKGSMDEILIQRFLEKQKLEKIDEKIDKIDNDHQNPDKDILKLKEKENEYESDQELILGNLFLNKLEDYSIGKNGIEIIYNGETCFLPKI